MDRTAKLRRLLIGADPRYLVTNIKMYLYKCQLFGRIIGIYFEKLVFLAFPPGCVSFYGPHIASCAISVFCMAGCTPNGYAVPSNLSQAEMNLVLAMNITFVAIPL